MLLWMRSNIESSQQARTRPRLDGMGTVGGCWCQPIHRKKRMATHTPQQFAVTDSGCRVAVADTDVGGRQLFEPAR